VANQYSNYPAGNRPASGSQTRPAARPAGSSTGTRSSANARPSAQRPAGSTQRPANRSGASARPNPNGARRQPPRRKKSNAGLYAVVAVVLILVAVIALVVINPFGGKDPQTNPQPTANPVAQTTSDISRADALAAMLGDQDAEVQALSADQMTHVTDLAVTQGLDESWINILLLGSDERTLTESARTDSMIICSINKNTGEVKLTSIMRDLAVYFDEIGEYAGTYRINAANYFGGEELAMRVVNECFGMNIQHYVRVNFYGFQQIAEILGGVQVDITEEEMNLINERIVEQAYLAKNNGIDESALTNQLLENYGKDTQLDGRQTLAYARLRKLDGGDYARAERQRTVLVKLMNKVQGMGMGEVLQIATAGMQHVTTNMDFNTMLTIASTVISSGITSVESLRLPINNSYVQETRREESMFYDCDWAANTSALYSFIYN